MRTLGRMFLVLLVSVALHMGGAWTNIFVCEHNGGKMPVVVIGDTEISPFDFRHTDMTKDSKDKILCDWIPLPFYHDYQVDLSIESAGDVMIDSANVCFLVAFLVPFFTFGRWAYVSIRGLISLSRQRPC